jgi:hypothetical protein
VADTVAPEFARFVAAQRPEGAVLKPPGEGQVGHVVYLSSDEAQRLLPVAARRAAGFFRPTTRAEVVWVDGESELAVSLTKLKIGFGNGFIALSLAVRCDQTGDAEVRVSFACGSPDRPAGLYAAAQRRPSGPELIVATWGDALVAFAWQCLLGLVSGLANASGKDARGNLMVPVEMVASPRGLQIVPMARHRFAGSSGLKPAKPTAPPRR